MSNATTEKIDDSVKGATKRPCRRDRPEAATEWACEAVVNQTGLGQKDAKDIRLNRAVTFRACNAGIAHHRGPFDAVTPLELAKPLHSHQWLKGLWTKANVQSRSSRKSALN